MAAHYLQAIAYRAELGERPDPELDRAALRWAWAAGDRAWRLWQQAEAFRWLRSALDLAERGDLPLEERARLAESTVRAASGLAAFDEVAATAREALDLFEEVGDQAAAGRMEATLAWVALSKADHEHVLPWAERAVARLEPLGDTRDLASTLEFFGNYHRRRGRVAEAEPLLRRAVDMAARIGAQVTEGHASVGLGIAMLHQGKIGEGMALVEAGFRIAQEAGDLELSLRAHNALASVLTDYAPDYDRGWSVLRAGIELSQLSGRRDHEAWLWSNVGDYAFHQGKVEELEQAGLMGREIGQALSHAYAVHASAWHLAAAAFLRGELDTAERHLSVFMDPAWLLGEIQGVPYGYLLKGAIAAARGRLEDALQSFREGVDLVASDPMLWMADALYFELIRALVLTGRRDEASSPLDTLRMVARGRPNSEAFLAWAEGLVAEDPGEAERSLRTAADSFRRLGRPIDEARCLLDLARVLRASGGDGSTDVERAREVLGAHGVEVYLRMVPEASASGGTA